VKSESVFGLAMDEEAADVAALREACRAALARALARGGFRAQSRVVAQLAAAVAECKREVMARSPAWGVPS
jgi:hypothetical protein